MNFELLRSLQLSAEHTMRLTLALAPVLAGWGTDILITLQISFWHVTSRKNNIGTLQTKPSAGLSTSARYACMVEMGSSLTFLLQFLLGLHVFPLQRFDPK